MIGLVSFRALERTDFPLLQQWLSAPHVDAWWHEPLDLRGLEQKYGPRIDGIEKVHVFIIEHEDRPIGWIQWYRWSDYPDHAAQLTTEQGAAGIDLAIGEVSSVGIGLGPNPRGLSVVGARDYLIVDPKYVFHADALAFGGKLVSFFRSRSGQHMSLVERCADVPVIIDHFTVPFCN